MGRSKFPGKPPKTVSRKRIKVLGQPETVQSDSVTVAENIYYGLSLFNETFGDNEKEHPPFHGFSSKEAKLSASYIKVQQQDAEDKTKNSPPTNSENAVSKASVQIHDTTDIQTTSLDKEHIADKLCDENVETDEKSERDTEVMQVKRSTKIRRSRNHRSCKSLKFSNFMKAPVLKSVKNILDQHQRSRHLRNSTARRLLQRAKSNNNNVRNIAMQSNDKSNAIRKFVLPIRSAHSSRVIKPNKRFIEELEEISITTNDSIESENEAIAKKAKVMVNNLSILKRKEKEDPVNLLCKKLKNKVRKNSQVIAPLTNKDSECSVQSAQITKMVQKDIKKSHNISNKLRFNNRISPSELAPNGDLSQNTADSCGAVQNTSRLMVSKTQKQISVPTKVLPTANVPSFESSRVQTRSGAHNELPTGPNSEEPTKLSETCDMKTQSQSNNRISNDNVDNFDSESSLSESGSEHSNHTEDEQSEWTGMKLNGGKVILRKARLKLDNKCFGGMEGPFSTTNPSGGSTNANPNLGLTGTIKCGVCGAVRFYRFVKQARKFGIHSCESCRKFISKMIKRQACSKSTNSTLPVLQCHKGDGLCLLPPVVRSQQWNLMRCVYKARCPACWLKMCLKCFNIPIAIKTSLNTMLPPILRDPLSISVPTGPEEAENHGQKLASCKIGWPADDCLEKNLFKSAISWRSLDIGQKSGHHVTTGSFLYSKLDKFDSPLGASLNKKRRTENRIKVRKKLKSPIFPSPSVNQGPPPPRQRLELKGPRVKHVCRSASVALGQPIATFPSVDGKDSGESNKNIPKSQKESEKPDKKDDNNTKDKEDQKQNNNISVNVNILSQSNARKVKSQQQIVQSNLSTVSKVNKSTNCTISIDFWEQYDPSEVGAKGFALIGSELFHIPAICYLCGSAGKEPFIHCQCCCEPYHAFCLEPSEWNACVQPNWCCPRCTICQICQLRSGPKLSCIRCRQSFHHSCLSKSGVSARLYSPDRPYICQSCVRCKSCGSEGVTVHVGNLPLCSMCFKLRQRGNYCPLCQRCYNENDFDTKMMECSECSCWVHAQCEGLSDERYQILSYLPDSIEFTCRQCSANPNSIWRNAVEAELKAGFIGVIKSLSKNRKACAALKWSPRKECLCRPLVAVRKLEFPDDKTETESNSGKNVSSVVEELEESNSDLKSGDVDTDQSSKAENGELTVEGPQRRGLRRLRQKFHLKDCTVKAKHNSKDCQDSGNPDEGKECNCSEQQIIVRPSPTLLSVKRKVNSNEYKSLAQFHCDMEYVIDLSGVRDLLEAYHKVLREVFPWFSPKLDSNNSGMLTPSKEDSCDVDPFSRKIGDDTAADTWKEDLMKAPKTIATKVTNLHSAHVDDGRSCCLCKGLSDGQETKEGRLLYCGQNEWVHANCALWSNEVFEEIDGSLQNVHSAISRGRLIRCTECGKKGASVGCCAKNCNNTFHYPCARSISLTFNNDKTVFCSLHLSNSMHKTAEKESDFILNRPVYVELDRKKKKYAEPDKVKVMIGSLMVDSLGSVKPEFSDTSEKIIPCDYKCSRLYWSTVNPFKIVRYYIRTYVQVYVPEVSNDSENNITINHTEEPQKAELGNDKQKLEYLSVKQTLDALIDSVCNREVDENLAEQNNTDLLPPELKEAIFEDLPHDLLDGISMQDIFTTYEDFLAMDLKTDSSFATDLLKDDMLSSDVDDMIKPSENKISKVDQTVIEMNPHNDLWVHLEAKGSMQELMDDLFSSKSQKRGGRELKRSKSEVMSNSPLIVGGHRHQQQQQQQQQRSCSLTWSCKLDNAYGSNAMRRKLPRSSSASKASESSGLMVVDTPERSSVFHELRIPESIMVTVGRANTPSIISDSVRELKYCIEDTNVINRRVVPAREDGKEHKRIFWHTRQEPRILQVDGTADACSSSECSSPEYSNDDGRTNTARKHEALSIPQLDGIDDETSCEGPEWNCRDSDLDLCMQNPAYIRSKRILGFLRSHVNTDTLLKGNERENFLAASKSTMRKCNPFKESGLKLSMNIPQLDGAGDISSDEECSSPQLQVEHEKFNVIPRYETIMDRVDRPVTCKRCRCTYRTQDSYNRHLSNCDIMITSDSDSETMDNKLASPDSTFSASIGSVSPRFITLSPSEGHTLSSDYPDMQATSPIEATVPSPHPAIQIEPIAQAIITPRIHTHATVETVHQTVLTSNDMIVQTQYTRTTTTLPNAAVLPQQESTVQITEITDPLSVSSDSSNSQSVVNLPMGSPDSASSLTVPSPQVSPSFPTAPVQQRVASSNDVTPSVPIARTTRTKSPRTPRQRAKSLKSQMLKSTVQSVPANHARYQPVQTSAPVIQLQQAQRPSAPTVILQQVGPPGIMSYVETVQQQQQQSGQNLQYITAIGNQHEASFKPQFITTNPLVPGAYIQAPSDNLLTLQNGGISILPSVQIAQPQPTVLGTIIQQQPSAIQCGVISSEQLLLSSTPTLEMFTDSTGSMFVSNQPMYYGLETIVSNTVMSSSQFMAGAVPQVLASSYQTTTQVFQASKLMEPIVDVQAVSAVPAVATMQTVHNVPGISNVPNVPTIPTVPGISSVSSVGSMQNVPNVSNVSGVAAGVPGVTAGYVVLNQAAPMAEAIPQPRINISATPEQSFSSVACDPISTAQCQPIMESVPTIQTSSVRAPEPHIAAALKLPSPPKPLQPVMSSIPRVAVRPSPIISSSVAQFNQQQQQQHHHHHHHHHYPSPLPTLPHPPLHHQQQQPQQSWKITEPLFGTDQPINNSARPYFDSKHVSENTSMIKSSISSKIPPLPNHCITQRNVVVNNSSQDVNSVHNSYSDNLLSPNNISISTNSNPVISSANVPCKISMPTNNVPTSRPMNRVLPMQAVTPKQEPVKPFEKEEIAIEEPTKPVIKPAEPEVTETKEDMIKEPVITIARDTNEQTAIAETEPKLVEIKEPIELGDDVTEKAKEDLQGNVETKEKEEGEKVQNSSLKIVLQKQVQDGSYKVTQTMQAKKTPQVISNEILTKPIPHIASLQLLPIKTFALKSNNKLEDKMKSLDGKMNNILKTKTPPIAVKKPRIITKPIESKQNDVPNNPPNPSKKCHKGPSLMYEIKSQDGFTHTASSMNEVWETVFQAVQTARKAHNLPPLPYNPLSENLGLDNNATVYLIEQLPGVNRCVKYKPRFHKLSSPKPGEIENDLPTECDNGAARAEPFKARKVHDMFSWLASRHRQQPKMISISEAESRMRVSSTNLPMAMRFRILKETSKESVGVYHSHIHGRGLFCLRDIEAGEMVIEYAGEVIRASLTDKREKYYDSKNIGCYMFKIDDHLVVDATMKGNAARFINHSCEPNCYSRVVDILGKKHILIFALRRIIQGEELTYDYKFPFEDIKIPCTCGSRRCRKYLN
ncbi:histone-lysine N-methyltransferase trithorax [Prorops nasuta]|uniref:histone-lysine N-methyltransferase trithorax n=1 Tax=Prorops nasuta TaxID=863751 RepID=UPI0034CD970E